MTRRLGQTIWCWVVKKIYENFCYQIQIKQYTYISFRFYVFYPIVYSTRRIPHGYCSLLILIGFADSKVWIIAKCSLLTVLFCWAIKRLKSKNTKRFVITLKQIIFFKQIKVELIHFRVAKYIDDMRAISSF